MTNHTEISSTNTRPVIYSPGMTLLWTFAVLTVALLSQSGITELLISQKGIQQEYNALRGLTDLSQVIEKSSFFLAKYDLVWPAALASAVLGIIGVFLAIGLKKGLSIRDYLELRFRVNWKVWMIWIAALLAALFLGEYISRTNDEFSSEFVKDIVTHTKNAPLLILSIGILTPVFEEMIFRGFLFKGLERSILGRHGTVWVTSLVFVLIHMQYNWHVLLLILPLALVLGYSRLYSGSLMVPIVLHAMNNSLAVFITLNELNKGISF